jgi:GH15 family glucan-1,4-alpha-glucosidase
MSARLEDYALLGDCETAALVSRDGSLDWLCWPRFDSPACFSALLGGPQNGHWLITPCDQNVRRQRRYRGDTLILETELETAEGAATLIEFMPPRGQASDIVRLVAGRRGQMRMRTELIVRFDYGSLVPWVTRMDPRTLRIVCGPDMVVLRTAVPLRGEDLKTVGEFTVSAGELVPFVLTYGASHLPVPAPIDPMEALSGTESYWREWAQRFTGAGEGSEPVLRSLITLKALTYRPTGGIVAAPTMSLPEQPGGARNWDYRYCWLRDATFTLLALMNAGYYEEAMAWRSWLMRAVAGDPSQVQIMYGLRGERRLAEWEIPWLPGYEGSRPVRVGNAAAQQLQIDIYGETMDALHHSRASGHAQDKTDWSLQQGLLQHLQQIWEQPDQGIWEVRGGPQHFTYSKIMAWVAFDRCVKAVEQFGLPGPIDEWRALRQRIHAEVCARGYNRELGAFVQSYESKELDASLLLMPLVGFLPPSDPRVRGTVHAIEKHLLIDGFVMRYDTRAGHDGLPPGEGVFLACSFWLADNLVLLGRRADAQRLYERLLGLRNDVGLLAEEYLPAERRMIGNFPQALSHIALVNTAHNLYAPQKPAEQRSGAASA